MRTLEEILKKIDEVIDKCTADDIQYTCGFLDALNWIKNTNEYIELTKKDFVGVKK